MNKIISMEIALEQVKDGMTIMVGGFLACGTPHRLVKAIAEKGVKDITLICNDTGFPDRGVGIWIVNKQVKKTIASHVGTNPETGRQMTAGEMEVVLVPQGTLAERVRSAGCGLGGILTPTGLGTIVEEGKQKIDVNGQTFLLEVPLEADLALIYGRTVDKSGNVQYEKAERNFNPLMAMAAKKVIVEAESIVEVGDIDPDFVMTPGIFVDHIVKGA